MNYFAPKQAAERYAAGRPDFHTITIGKVYSCLQTEKKLNKALDIACGTGLSSKALLSIAEEVYGTDTSQAMLDQAAEKNKIHYVLAKAEEQPFKNEEFDLITVCSAVHWFDIDSFLKEANRLLKPKSPLVLYDNFFSGSMAGNNSFEKWYTDVYQEKFPPPARNNQYDWSEENLRTKFFQLKNEERFTNAVTFTLNDLVLYLTTQSNVSSQVSAGKISYEESEEWLRKSLVPFFAAEEKPEEFLFGNWLRILFKLK